MERNFLEKIIAMVIIFLVDLYQEHFGYSSTDNKIKYQSDYAKVLPYPEHEKFIIN
jgi:hypothetical protein